ncbi:MAG TPA: TolC family protein [Vicinamibacterales bacterium]
MSRSLDRSSNRRPFRVCTPVLVAGMICLPLPRTLAAQTSAGSAPAASQEAPSQSPAASAPRILSLDDALALAEARNEQVAIAEAGVTRARGNEGRARSERLPQLSGAASYDRTLASEFEGIFDSTDFGGGDGTDTSGFEDLPFGQENVYRLGLSFSQLLYAGGRVSAQERQARFARENATLGLATARAQLALDVAQAFYDAALADRLVTIAEETYAQADRTFKQTQAQREAGRVSEFELLRAQVDRDTLEPQVVRARATRDVAYLRLKQLLDLPLDAPIELAARLDDDRLEPAARFASAIAAAEAAVASRERTAVVQAQNLVRASEEGVTIARSQRLPSVSLNSSYGLVNYPAGLPGFDDWRTNWTVGVGLTVPIFTGGRIKADETVARADVDEARARLQLTRELADLDAASALAELRAARAEWEASAGTIQQAARAYEIAELRFREGISTQLELSDARLLLAQAQVNRARAARDLQLTRVRYALLPELPLGTTGSSTAAATTPAQSATQQTRQAQQTQRSTGTAASTPGAAAGTQGAR